MSYTDYFEQKNLERAFGNVAWTPPSNWYVALFTVAPGETGGGTEVSGGSYARATVPNDQTNGWNAYSSGAVSNKNAINFPTATASWGTVVAGGLFDASSGGNLCVKGALTTPKVIDTDDTATFGAGQLSIALD